MSNKKFEDLIRNRPETFEGYDCEERKPLSQEYFDRTMPEHVKKRIAEREAKREDVAQSLPIGSDQKIETRE